MSICSGSHPDSGISDQPDENESWFEHFHNLGGLVQDLSYLPDMPDVCDVVFFVGEQKLPLFGVKAVLAIRSRVFYKMLYGPKSIASKRRIQSQTPVSSVGRRLQKMFGSDSSLRRSVRQSQMSMPNIPAYAQDKTAIIVDEFEADVFKQLLEFVHTGSVTFQPNTVLGLLNAADHYFLEDLRKACLNFANCCVNSNTVCSLLASAERYIHYKSTKIFVQKLLDFVVDHGDEVLCLEDFVYLPQHVVELILSRENLRASELTKYRAIQKWASNYIQVHGGNFGALMQRLIPYIAFQDIPTSVLMQEIRPQHIVPDRVLVPALAFQADPTSVTELQLNKTPRTSRRWSMINPPNQSVDLVRSKSVSRPYGCSLSSADSSGFCDSLSGFDEIQSNNNLSTLIRVNTSPKSERSDLSKARSSTDLYNFHERHFPTEDY